MKREKNIEEFTKYVMKEVNIESPSKDFVDKVMNTIDLENSTVDTRVYKPIISNTGWVFIVLIIIGLCTFILTGNFENPEFLSNIDLSFLDKLASVNLLEGIKISKIFTFSMVLFSAFVIFQMAVIKNYFHKQHMA